MDQEKHSFFSINRLTFLNPLKRHSFAALAGQSGSSECHIGVHNSGQDRMTFFVSQTQPGLDRCYLRTSVFFPPSVTPLSTML